MKLFFDAVENGNMDYINQQITNGININDSDSFALRLAAQVGQLDIADRLITAGANIHACNDGALREAVVNKHLEVVELLLSKGADIHANSNDALRLAAHHGHTEIAKFLLFHGAVLDILPEGEQKKELGEWLAKQNAARTSLGSLSATNVSQYRDNKVTLFYQGSVVNSENGNFEVKDKGIDKLLPDEVTEAYGLTSPTVN